MSPGLNLLALDTSTEWMSIGVQRGGCEQPWLLTDVGGALASRNLIAGIQALMKQAGLQFDELDAVVFGAGPGSFTGLRTACSVTQGLAFAAGVPALPVNTLLAVAEDARMQLGEPQALHVTALLDARMNEMYMAEFAWNGSRWQQLSACELVKPANLKLPVPGADGAAGHRLVGNVFQVYAEQLDVGSIPCLAALPTAAALLRLAPGLLAAGGAVQAQDALPTYVRDKVAQTTQEREALQRKAAT